MVRFDEVVVTCEHASNHVPRALLPRFDGYAGLLASHRGYDAGARQLATAIAKAFAAPVFLGRVSRLVVDLNRSKHHPRLFFLSRANLPASERADLITQYYNPYRQAVEDVIGRCRGRVLHLSVHTFTPELDGKVRNADLGFLYDPAREVERRFCADWRGLVRESHPGYRVRMNYPYRGTADGFTTYLRRRFSERRYCGIELEVNQRLAAGSRRDSTQMQHVLIKTLSGLLQAA